MNPRLIGLVAAVLATAFVAALPRIFDGSQAAETIEQVKFGPAAERHEPQDMDTPKLTRRRSDRQAPADGQETGAGTSTPGSAEPARAPTSSTALTPDDSDDGTDDTQSPNPTPVPDDPGDDQGGGGGAGEGGGGGAGDDGPSTSDEGSGASDDDSVSPPSVQASPPPPRPPLDDDLGDSENGLDD